MANTPRTRSERNIDLEKLRVEIDVIIFTLLLNLGFLKITEVATFIGQITDSFNNLNLLTFILITSAVLAYMAYAGSILVGLLLSFRSKNARPAMITALLAFFAMYTCVFMNAVGHAQIDPQGASSRSSDGAAASVESPK